MKLQELLRDVPVRAIDGDSDVEITAVCADSRLVMKDALFAAIPGLQQDGAKYIDQAISKGAAAVLTELSGAPPPSAAPLAGTAKTTKSAAEGAGAPPKTTFVHVEDARAALALAAANFYGRPADKLSIVGVTGTSGKTTTTKMLESAFDASKEPVGLIGTIEYRAGDERLMADRTTPDAVVLQDWFARMVKAGVTHVAMEVSSHALALKRTHGIRFAAAIFTNLSRDHFDFHKDFDDYFAAKRILFDQIDRSRPTAVINIDDEYGRRLAAEMGKAAVTFGRSEKAAIRPAKDFEISVRGLHGLVMTPQGEIQLASRLLGEPNLYNWLGAIGGALVAGISTGAIERGIRDLGAVRGRFERVDHDGGPTVIVDYAHKPDALEKLLHAVRDLAGKKRVVLLFGCGGDRDKGKRQMMGNIATKLADFCILTSDNPRGEKADAILDEIERGVSGGAFRRVTDRRQAIAGAIEEAGEDDLIVIAGKGHETYQVVGDQVLHFDDREEAEIALKKRYEKTVLN